LASCPILLLGNKIDKQGAAGEHEIRQIFKLFGKTTGQVNLDILV
jgi:GTP-binding protein SAR1